MAVNSRLCRSAALVLLAFALGCNAQQWTASLDAASQVPPNTEEQVGGATGTFTLWSTADGGLEYSLEVSEITNMVMAHIHVGNATTSGGLALTLVPELAPINEDGSLPMIDPVSGMYSIGPVPFTPADFIGDAEGWTWDEFLDAADAEGLYVNVHTVEFPGGAIRGQIVPVPDLTYTATLNGENQVPEPVDTAAMATFKLTSDGEEYTYELAVTGIEGLTMAHIHIGNASSAGDVAVFLVPVGELPVDGALPMLMPAESGSLSFTGTFTDADLNGITGEEFRSLLRFNVQNNFYINVHTEAYPGGEIRGQLTWMAAAAAPAPATMDMEAPTPTPSMSAAAAPAFSKALGLLAAALLAAALL